jgi:thiamine transport system substrate-binding protein
MRIRLVFVLCILILLFDCGCKPTPSAELTVYTYSSFPQVLTAKITRHFKKVNGQIVNFKSFSDTGPLFNQLVLEKKAPRADVVIGLDHNYLTKIMAENLLQPYKPKAASKLKREMVFDSNFNLIPFDYGYVVLNYNREQLKQLPRTHLDLTRPEYRGKIILENPLTSSPGQIFLLTTIALYGEPGYLDYWRKLKPNLLTITAGWDEAYGMYTQGEAPIVLSYATSPVYHLLNEHTEKYRALILDHAAYAQIEGVGIVRNAPNPKAAQQLVEYLLTPELQKLIPESQFMYPVRTDVALPVSFRIAGHVKNILNIPPAKVNANLQRWLAEWEKMMDE